MIKPQIAITTDLVTANHKMRYHSAAAYAQCIADAGGMPVLIPPISSQITHYLAQCHAFVFTGGDDPTTEQFGQPTHPKATPVDPQRQTFELELLEALQNHRHIPALGICFGMQLMALHAGGQLNQHLPDTLDKPQLHAENNIHPIHILVEDSPIVVSNYSTEHMVVSSHHQAVKNPGGMRTVAVAPDGVIEAIDQPGRGPNSFYLGVQYHPERNEDSQQFNVNQQLFHRLVAACRQTI